MRIWSTTIDLTLSKDVFLRTLPTRRHTPLDGGPCRYVTKSSGGRTDTDLEPSLIQGRLFNSREDIHLRRDVRWCVFVSRTFYPSVEEVLGSYILPRSWPLPRERRKVNQDGGSSVDISVTRDVRTWVPSGASQGNCCVCSRDTHTCLRRTIGLSLAMTPFLILKFS